MTREDLEQIGELLHPIYKKLEKLDTMPTLEEVKSIVATNNKIMGTIIKIELAEFREAVTAGFQEMVTQTKEAIKASEERVKAEIHAERIKELEKRIETLERHTGLHKN